MVMTPYPEALVRMTDQLVRSGIDLPIVAGSAWGTVDTDVMRRFVASKKRRLLYGGDVASRLAESRIFETTFLSAYGRDPTPENAYGYDLGVIAGTVFKRIQGIVSPASFRRAFDRTAAFTGFLQARCALVPPVDTLSAKFIFFNIRHAVTCQSLGNPSSGEEVVQSHNPPSQTTSGHSSHFSASRLRVYLFVVYVCVAICT